MNRLQRQKLSADMFLHYVSASCTAVGCSHRDQLAVLEGADKLLGDGHVHGVLKHNAGSQGHSSVNGHAKRAMKSRFIRRKPSLAQTQVTMCNLNPREGTLVSTRIFC